MGVVLLVALACNWSATTANISSFKVSKDKSAASENSSFAPNDTVYAVAQISNTSDKHKVTSRILFDDVKGQESGAPVPGAETTIDVPGAAAATFTLSPPSVGWPNGKYKIEVIMKNEDGKQIDQKSATFTVSGGTVPPTTGDEN
jgi:hypothetical protein